MVAITFDDGPSREFTRDLGYSRIRCTGDVFMVVTCGEIPDIAQRIVEEGHAVGNHTHNHRDILP